MGPPTKLASAAAAAAIPTPNAATFDDNVDYPLAAPETMGRAIAISMLRGSVSTFAQRHRAVQEGAVRPRGWLEEFAGDVYRFARLRGFNKEEAGQVRDGMREKYGNLAMTSEAVGALAAAATPATGHKKEKKRKREGEADGDVSARKSKKAKSPFEDGQDSGRRLKKQKSSKKLQTEKVHTPPPPPPLKNGARRRSRSTSLEELGPDGTPLRRKSSPRKRSTAHSEAKAGKDTRGDDRREEKDDERPVFRVQMSEGEVTPIHEGQGRDKRPPFDPDVMDEESNGPPHADDPLDEVIIPADEDDSEAEEVDDEEHPVTWTARDQLRSGSPFSDNAAAEEDDQRPSFAVDWSSSAAAPAKTTTPPRELAAPADGGHREVTATMPPPKTKRKKPTVDDEVEESAPERRSTHNISNGRATLASPLPAGVFDSLSKRQRKRLRKKLASSPSKMLSSDPVENAFSPSPPKATIPIEQNKTRRKLTRFTVGGSAPTLQRSPDPPRQEDNAQPAEASVQMTKKERKAERKALRAEMRRLEKQQRKAEVQPRVSRSTPLAEHEQQEPMPKDLERIFMNITEIEPESPPRRAYCDMAVQTSPSILPKAAPVPVAVVSQTSSRSRPSQQPSPTETQSSESLKHASFEKRTPVLTSSKKVASSARQTPATSLASSDRLAQVVHAQYSSPKAATGKLKRIKPPNTTPQHAFELGTTVQHHKPCRSADYSVAETASIPSPAKSTGLEVAETLEAQPPSTPELGLDPSPNNYQMDEDSSSVVLGGDDNEDPNASDVKDSQRVLSDSFPVFSAGGKGIERSQMGVGIFDRTERGLSTYSEDVEEESTDDETNDDIPHHIEEPTTNGSDEGKESDEDISEPESEPESDGPDATMTEAHQPSSLVNSPATDDMQDLINSQLQDEIAFGTSQLRSQELSPQQPRKKKEMATTVARRTNATSPGKKTGTSSEHFSPSRKVKTPKTPGEGREPKSGLPFPSIHDESFGLFQERYAADPFKLLIATMFVNQTQGKRAIPVVEQLMQIFPTAAHLAKAEASQLEAIIRHLGLGEQRARRLVKLAQVWEEQPPALGMRYRIYNGDYPSEEGQKAAKASKAKFVVADADDCGAYLEIAHLPGCGPYAFDSWRIFCRDVFRGVAQGGDGEGVAERSSGEGAFQPEWMRVLPRDKELRAFLRWMWLKEGFAWDWHTGERAPADRELLRLALTGGPAVESRITKRFKGNRKSDVHRLDQGDAAVATTELEGVAAAAANATSSTPDRVRRAISSEFVVDEIEDDEMPDVRDEVDKRPSESVRPPSTPPLRRLGINGRAIFSMRRDSKRGV